MPGLPFILLTVLYILLTTPRLHAYCDNLALLPRYSSQFATQERLGNAEIQLETARQELQTARQESEATHQELETACQELETARQELETAHRELETKNTELETKNRELEAKNTELETARQELATKNTELETTHTELGAKNSEIAELHQTITAKQMTGGVTTGADAVQMQAEPYREFAFMKTVTMDAMPPLVDQVAVGLDTHAGNNNYFAETVTMSVGRSSSSLYTEAELCVVQEPLPATKDIEQKNSVASLLLKAKQLSQKQKMARLHQGRSATEWEAVEDPLWALTGSEPIGSASLMPSPHNKVPAFTDLSQNVTISNDTAGSTLIEQVTMSLQGSTPQKRCCDEQAIIGPDLVEASALAAQVAKLEAAVAAAEASEAQTRMQLASSKQLNAQWALATKPLMKETPPPLWSQSVSLSAVAVAVVLALTILCSGLDTIIALVGPGVGLCAACWFWCKRCNDFERECESKYAEREKKNTSTSQSGLTAAFEKLEKTEMGGAIKYASPVPAANPASMTSPQVA